MMTETDAGPWEPSPVPADRDLLEGDLPFTAWDQYPPGVIDLRVFDQGVWWVDVNRQPHLLTEMSLMYLINVIAHLEERAALFHLATQSRLLVESVTDVLSGRVPTEWCAQAAGATPLSMVTATVWLESTPLMRALRAKVALHSLPDSE